MSRFNFEYDLPPTMETEEEVDARRMQESIALDERIAHPNRFREFASTLTPPGSYSPMAQHVPGVGEHPSPTVMGKHTEDFAYELGIPFEQEDHRITSLEDNEFMSTIPPAAVNTGPSLQGMYNNNFGKQPSLLMESVSVNPELFGGGHEPWPEGAIDYVAQRCGRSELEDDWDRYSKIGGEHITPEYVANKTADPGWSPPESSFWVYDQERWL